MRKIFKMLPGIVLAVTIAWPSAGQSAAGVILGRHREYLHQMVPVSTPDVREWMQKLRPDGSWPDIDYSDRQRANWTLLFHLRRVEAFCLAWTDHRGNLFGDSALHRAINSSLDNWLRHQYQNPNWWHNQIGVPQYMRDILVLVMPVLSDWQKTRALKVLAQLHVQRPGAGANLTWSADLGLYLGLLTGDAAQADSCRDLIAGEIRITTGDGLQPDYSFHQHHARLQMYQYGKSFLWSNVRLGWELRGTPMAFADSTVDLLTHFLIRGWQWMARGINTVPGTMDRSSSREGELRSPDLRALIPYLKQLDPGHRRDFRRLARIQEGRRALEGFRYYPYSDFAAFHRKHFSFFLKTLSSRTMSTEVGLNRENLKGALLNSGDAYLIADGREYFNLMPLWDWSRLPGITAFDGAATIERKPFTGSVSDGSAGLSAMDYRMENKTGDAWVGCHKIWACYDNTVVCLVAGLRTHGIPGRVYTVLEQSRRQGPVRVSGVEGLLGAGVHSLSGLQWIYHAGFGYIPLRPSAGIVSLEHRRGSWSEINVSESDSILQDDVFTAELDNSGRSSDTAFGYVLAYTGSAQRTATLAAKPAWDVWSNTAGCQAVMFPHGMLMAAFFSAGSLRRGEQVLTTDKPCLVLVSRNKVYVSDPGHQGGVWHISWGDRTAEVRLPADGSSREVSFP